MKAHSGYCSISIIIILVCCSIPCFAQIKTDDADPYVSVNGIKYGYVYTLEQLKEALGEATSTDSYPLDFGGNGYYLRFGDDLTIQFNDNTRPEDTNGILSIIIKSPKYALNIYGTEIRVGDPISKIKNMPDYVGMKKWDENMIKIYFCIMDDDIDPSLAIELSEEGIITFISFAQRYD